MDPGYFFQERFQAVPNSQTSNSSWNLRNCPIQDQLLMFWQWRGKSWKRCAGAADDPTLQALSWNAGCPNLSISSHIAGLATGLATKLVACYQFEGVRSCQIHKKDLTQPRLLTTLHITVSDSQTETSESHFMKIKSRPTNRWWPLRKQQHVSPNSCYLLSFFSRILR